MSRLFLKAESRNGKTVISDSFFTAPIKIAKPFYCGNYTEIMMMTASAGILDGDFYDIEIQVMEGASFRLTGQSYTKIFKAAEKGAVQKVKINVEKDAFFIYFPMPVIPYGGSIFSNITEVHLCKNCRFVMCDILSCGRKAMNEEFLFQSYRSRTAVYVDGKMQFLDNQRFNPNEINLKGMGFFEGYSHAGMMYIYGCENVVIPESQTSESAVTKAADGTCIRIFSNSADEIVNQFRRVISQLS
ncbi:urease accessory protein UreD [Porcipelethomonas sp.]|uniref:urease accessory protein UreD n=1 Tax=Porcipelethomonas sp. TaxID=2981675 RepID=UPI003EF87733